jgi:hypothetical protein
MRWAFLGIATCAVVSLWGIGPGYALFAAFCVLFANFATLCVLYERPKNRARSRIADRLRRLHPNTDMAQRLATATITPTAADRRLGFGPMPLLNLATAVAGGGLLIWGIVLRAFFA